MQIDWMFSKIIHTTDSKSCTCLVSVDDISWPQPYQRFFGNEFGRRAPPVYELEVDFFVDQSLMKRYVAEATSARDGLISLKADINYILTEMNEMFASLRPMGLHIVILKRKLFLLRTNLFLDNLPSKLALKAFDDWLAKQGPATYDAAILWTA
ncbi:hypothetical protein PoB_006924400, partial [Plakobranchus ocellatus]